jgi:zinc/manganese transport system permease protein
MSLTEFFLEPFRHDFMLRALVSSVLLGLVGGLLGPLLVLRRMALMGDALSHSLLPGIALAWLLFGPSPTALLLGALLAGLLTAFGGAAVSRLTVVKEDAAFGALFLVFFASGIALLSRLPTRFNLTHFLFGNILGITPADLVLVGAVTVGTVLALYLFRRPLLLETFDPGFHRATGGSGRMTHVGFLILVVLNLVAGLQTMGVVLVLGLFLLPAVIARLWCERYFTQLPRRAAKRAGYRDLLRCNAAVFTAVRARARSGCTPLRLATSSRTAPPQRRLTLT